METVELDRPWEELSRRIEAGDAAAVAEYIDGLSSGESARAVSRLEEQQQTALLSLLDPEDAADLLDLLSDVQAASLVEQVEPNAAAAILGALPSNDRVDLLAELPGERAEAILAELPPEDAAGARTLIEYERDVAGGRMQSEYLSFPRQTTVAQVVDDLRDGAERYRDYDVQYTYVTGRRGRLVGVLRLRDLLLARRGETIESLMIPEPLSVRDTTPLDELEDFFEENHFLAVPVTNERGRLVGVLRSAAVAEALAERGESDYRKSQGIVGGEELRTMPLLLRSRRRLSWLSINIVLNVISISIISMFQETLTEVIALAIFLPLISDMSGCSGAQAVAVSMRELALGLVTPKELLRVLGKEAAVGVLNGAALGTLVALVARFWFGEPINFGLVVGAAMAINTVIAVSIGGAIPLLLKRRGLDPALASGPILTTVTDMCGFLLVLGLATLAIDSLTQ